MALELKLDIRADATQAKAELRAVELGIGKVETAARETESPLQKTAQALGGYGVKADDVVRSSDRLATATRGLGDTSKLTTEQVVQQNMALMRAETAMADNASRARDAAQAQGALAGGVGLAAGALQVSTAAAGAFLAVGALELEFL